MDHILLIHASINGRSRCFHRLATLSDEDEQLWTHRAVSIAATTHSAFYLLPAREILPLLGFLMTLAPRLLPPRLLPPSSESNADVVPSLCIHLGRWLFQNKFQDTSQKAGGGAQSPPLLCKCK